MQQYVVKPNDTLYIIAKEFDVPLAQLIKANPQITNPDVIQVGQTIIIPDIPAVPNEAGIIESNAVMIIDDIIMNDWESALRRVNEVRTAVNDMVPMMREAQVPNNVINGMNTAIRTLEQNILQRRTFSAISQANHLTQLLADALDFFNVLIPTDVIRLAYFARQMIINIEQNDWPEALQNYRRALTVWERIRPELVESYATDVSNFDRALDDINEAIGRRDYLTSINSASRMLELTNVLASNFEQLYT